MVPLEICHITRHYVVDDALTLPIRNTRRQNYGSSRMVYVNYNASRRDSAITNHRFFPLSSAQNRCNLMFCASLGIALQPRIAANMIISLENDCHASRTCQWQ